MEVKRNVWQSDNGIWKVTARIFNDEYKGEKSFGSDVTLTKLVPKSGRFELYSIRKKLPRYVEKAIAAAFEFTRKEHLEFVRAIELSSGDPFAALCKNDQIVVHTSKGNTGNVFFVAQDTESITVLNYVYDTEEVIQKANILELYHVVLQRNLYPTSEKGELSEIQD